ncbi:biopolymer transporter ExbD [Flavobacteriaceae bacterium Ap0902]|nr:biopolymer transporter ExbD [Flavobacteriaceae bacterium Ap0902]
MDLKSRNKIDPNFSMSSMTDIVFLLLIFFLLTSTMVPTNVLDLKLPKANGTSVQQEQVTVSIDNNGLYYLGENQIGRAQLEENLKGLLNNQTDAAFILQAEEESTTGDIVFVMDIANRNGYKMVLATQPKD